MKLDINAFLALILGGGLAGSLTTLLNSYRSVRDGARTREKGTIEDLISQRKSAIEERDQISDDRDRWRNRAGDLEFLMRQAGLPIPPLKE